MNREGRLSIVTQQQSAIPPRIEGAEWLERHETQAVFAALASAGHAARAVGGAVRNTLLGTPVADIDIATSAPPQEMLRAAALAHLKVVPTGLAHGTVTIVSGHIPYEVTTLRQDVETFGVARGENQKPQTKPMKTVLRLL